MSRIKEVGLIIISILIPEIVGGLSAYLSGSGMKELYETLNKPELAPPGYVFGIVWTILYALMGYASYRVITAKAEKKQKQAAIIYYGIQLFLNFMWSIVFFGMQAYTSAAWLIVLILIAIAITLYRFYKLDKVAGYLLIPYIIWVTFATYLSIYVAMNN